MQKPKKSLEEYSYGGVLFAKLISEKYGGYRTIKRIWELQGSKYKESIGAINSAIAESYKNEDLGSVFNKFSAYNYNPAQYYKEGHLWTYSPAFQNSYEKYPVEPANGKLNHLSSNYQLFKLSEELTNKDLKITINDNFKSRIGFKLQKKRRIDAGCDFTEIKLQSSKRLTEVIIKNPAATYSEICLIPSNLENSKDNMEYRYFVNLI